MTLTTTASDGGTVAPAGQTTYVSGQAVDVTFTPDQGYQLASVKVNGRTRLRYRQCPDPDHGPELRRFRRI